ncbi:MAG TPA: hypothetical protein VF582_08435, partial [Allosphingosinicella sp.]
MRKKGAALRAVQDGEMEMGPGSGPGLRGTAGVASSPVPLEFAPVPRRYRHDGWTPERQKAFIGALADTGCVTRAAGQVNMAQTNCYTLRRAAGAESFGRAWDAALDFGLKRLKDIAFERAIEGQLVPVFVAGKLMGFRRKRNDALLMFCLRHYGQDANGKRITINYFSSRASAGVTSGSVSSSLPAGAAPPPPSAVPLPQLAGGGMAEASTTTVRTVISGAGAGGDPAAEDDAAAALLNGFEGVELDAEAAAAIQAALEACAARARAAEAAYGEGGEAAADAAADDPETSFVRVAERGDPYRGELLPPVTIEEFVPFTPGEPHWSLAGAEKPAELIRWEEEMARKGRGEKRKGFDRLS